MADPRFFTTAGPFTLSDVAKIAGAELAGATKSAKSGRMMTDVSALDSASDSDVSFFDNKRYLESFRASKAGACIVAPAYAEQAPEGMALLLTDKPYKAYALVAQAFYPNPRPVAGVHSSAVIDPTATIGEGSEIGANVVIGAGAEIGKDCIIKAGAVISDGVIVGAGTEIGSTAALSHCLIGRHCQIHAGVCIGNRGFGFAMDPEGIVDVPQLGRVIIEDGVEVGANSTIDRGAGPDTVIGAGSKIDNLVQIGHNVRLGRSCVLIAQVGIAGSATLDDHVAVGGQSGVAGHITLGKGVQVAASSGVMRNVSPGEAVGGTPAMPIRDYFRLYAMWRRQLKTKVERDE